MVASCASDVKVCEAVAKTSAAVTQPGQSDCGVQPAVQPEGLCTVWRDPQFDVHQNAYYYARAFEIPSCRWSTHMCVKAGVQCAALDPANGVFPAQSGFAGYEGCCRIDGAPGPFKGRNIFATDRKRVV